MLPTACSETPEESLATLFLDLFESNVTLLHALEFRPDIQAVALDVPAVSVSRREFTVAVARAVVRRGLADRVLEALAEERPRRLDSIREVSESLTALRVAPLSARSPPARRRALFAGISTIVGCLLLTALWSRLDRVVEDRRAEPPPVLRHAAASVADDEHADERICMPEPPLRHETALTGLPPEHMPTTTPEPRRAVKPRPRGSPTVRTISATVVSGKTGQEWPVALPAHQTAGKAAKEIFKIRHLEDSPAAAYVDDDEYSLCEKTRGCFTDTPVIDSIQEGDVLQVRRVQKDNGYQHRGTVTR